MARRTGREPIPPDRRRPPGLENIQRDGKPVAGAEPGNTRAFKHGARADLQLAPRAEQLRDGLAVLVPTGDERDLPALSLLAWQLARIERANNWLDEQGFIGHERAAQGVLRALSTWENSAARLCNALGLSPTSRARLGLTHVRGKALSEHLERTYERREGDAR
jgi:hypothetical protein